MKFRVFCETQKVLYNQLLALRPQMAQAVQTLYNEWETNDDVGYGGICDEVANEIGTIIALNIQDVELQEGGQPGDDHAYTIAYNALEAYEVDIDPDIYERGGGYIWTKIPGVVFQPNHVMITEVPRHWIEPLE